MWKPVLLGALLFGTIFVWTLPVPHGLTVTFLSVSQGDAVLIEGPTGIKVLYDTGPADRSVLRALGTTMPFFDRSIDGVIASHPTTNYVGGVPDVLDRYHVGTFLESGTLESTNTKIATAVSDTVKKSGVKTVFVHQGTRLILGGGAYADILFPSDVAPGSKNKSDYVVMHVVYGKTSVLLTGGLSKTAGERLALSRDSNLASDVFQTSNAVSSNSGIAPFIQMVAPSSAVYAGVCKNSFSSTLPETVSIFSKLSMRSFDTCAGSSITFGSNGNSFFIRSRR